jgi:hypothetical protein
VPTNGQTGNQSIQRTAQMPVDLTMTQIYKPGMAAVTIPNGRINTES